MLVHLFNSILYCKLGLKAIRCFIIFVKFCLHVESAIVLINYKRLTVDFIICKYGILLVVCHWFSYYTIKSLCKTVSNSRVGVIGTQIIR